MMLACWKASTDVSPFLVGYSSVSSPVSARFPDHMTSASLIASSSSQLKLSLHILLAAKWVPLSWLQVFRCSVGSVWLEIKGPQSAVLISASGRRCRAPAAEKSADGGDGNRLLLRAELRQVEAGVCGFLSLTLTRSEPPRCCCCCCDS